MSDLKVAEDGIEVASTLDAKGLSCPMPLLRTKKEIGKIASGEVLQIDGTDPGSRNDLPGWCARAGHEYEFPGEYHVQKSRNICYQP